MWSRGCIIRCYDQTLGLVRVFVMSLCHNEIDFQDSAHWIFDDCCYAMYPCYDFLMLIRSLGMGVLYQIMKERLLNHTASHFTAQ